jgi:hypothetical protein
VIAMAKQTNPFRYFDSSPEVIRTIVMMYGVPLVNPALSG